jgi:N-acetylmuramoyl-L-alanine amidase
MTPFSEAGNILADMPLISIYYLESMGLGRYFKSYMRKTSQSSGRRVANNNLGFSAPHVGKDSSYKPLCNMQVGRRFVIAAGSSAIIAPTIARAADKASAMRLHDHGSFTRLVLELSGGVDFSIFQLAEPYRIVVDLPELDWAIAGDGASERAGLVKAVRFGLFQPGNARIVVDLAQPSGVKNAFVLPATGNSPFRFVLDLELVSSEKFMAGVGQRYRTGSFAALVEKDAPTSSAVSRDGDKFENPRVDLKQVIVLDPGHGGVDPGAIGVSGIYEKVITLAAARQLKTRLEETGRYKVVLTRDRDISLGLRERREIAHRAEADLFISLHADSMKNKSVRGLSVYTLSERASDKEAEALAEQENNADIIIGVDLSHESREVRHILVDLAQRESMNLATKLASKLIIQLQRDVKLLRNTHRFAGFAVLKSPDIPSVLIEMGYLSNRDDEKALKQVGYRNKLMAAVARGLDDHMGTIQSARRK